MVQTEYQPHAWKLTRQDNHPTKEEMKMEFKKNPEAVARSAIESAQISAAMEQMRSEGKTEKEIAAKFFNNEDYEVELTKFMAILLNLDLIGNFFNHKRTENPALLGYVHIVKDYTDTPEAIEFDQFWQRAKTNKDVYQFACQKLDMSENKIETLDGYDKAYFEKWLATTLEKVFCFGISKKHAEDLYATSYKAT